MANVKKTTLKDRADAAKAAAKKSGEKIVIGGTNNAPGSWRGTRKVVGRNEMTKEQEYVHRADSTLGDQRGYYAGLNGQYKPKNYNPNNGTPKYRSSVQVGIDAGYKRGAKEAAEERAQKIATQKRKEEAIAKSRKKGAELAKMTKLTPKGPNNVKSKGGKLNSRKFSKGGKLSKKKC